VVEEAEEGLDIAGGGELPGVRPEAVSKADGASP
jgi:hypothetical protein